MNFDHPEFLWTSLPEAYFSIFKVEKINQKLLKFITQRVFLGKPTTLNPRSISVLFTCNSWKILNFNYVTCHYCHNQTVKLWKNRFERVCHIRVCWWVLNIKGRGLKFQPQYYPIFYFMGVTKIMMDCVSSNVSNFNRWWVWEILSDSDYNWYGANNGLSGNILEFLIDQTQNLGLFSDNDVIINHLLSDCLSD